MSCSHPEGYRLWPSNWQWLCLICHHIVDVPEGAVGVVNKEDT